MNEHTALHHRAMAKMDQHLDARKRGDIPAARAALREALSLESRAASLVPDQLEPTRSILYRSAASIAMQAGQLAEMRRLIAEALRGNPPGEIKNELLELLLVEASQDNPPSRNHGESDSPELPPSALIQTLTIRQPGQTTPIPMALAARIQECWSRLYRGIADGLFDFSPALFPLQASLGSYIVTIQIDAEDADSDAAFAAFRHLSRVWHEGMDIASPHGLKLSSSFLALMSTLAEYQASLEARMARAGATDADHASTSIDQPESFELEALAPDRIKTLYQQANDYVDSLDVPQADDLAKVFRFVDIIASGKYPEPEDLDVVPRQINYYRRATEILGYLDDGVLTPAGWQIASLPTDDRFRSAVVHFESSHVGRAWIHWSQARSLDQVDPSSAQEFLDSRALGLRGDTVARRAKSLAKWCQILLAYHYRRN